MMHGARRFPAYYSGGRLFGKSTEGTPFIQETDE
jgi:hypothetical protein